MHDPMEERVLTLHPQGKKGVNISRAKYDAMKTTILALLGRKQLTHDELTREVTRALEGKFDGSIPWYMESTKLDLEARRVIERATGGNHDVYRLKK